MIHISQQNVSARPEEYNEQGFMVVRECQAAAQRLMAANYHPAPVVAHNGAEAEKAELQRFVDPALNILEPITDLHGVIESLLIVVLVDSRHTKSIFAPPLLGAGLCPERVLYAAKRPPQITPQP